MRTLCVRPTHPHATAPPPPRAGVVLVEAFGSDVAIVRRQGSSHRRLTFVCSDGHDRHMLVRGAGLLRAAAGAWG